VLFEKLVAKELRDRGVSAEHYHADMDIVAREKIHMRYVQNSPCMLLLISPIQQLSCCYGECPQCNTVFKNMVTAIAVLWLYSGIDGLAAQAVLGGFRCCCSILGGWQGCQLCSWSWRGAAAG